MSSQIEELEATIRELQATLENSPPEMRPLLGTQIENMISTVALLRSTLPQIDDMKKLRKPLDPETAAFFKPEPAAELPVWLADSARRGDITDAHVRCPPGAKVYYFDNSVSCSVPGVPGVSLSTANGLSLDFRADGQLAGQSFFEQGKLRWSITYHQTGGRDAVGFWVSTEPKVYIEDGLHTRYAPNGAVTSQVHWRAGTKHGWDKKWEDDGFPIGATLFDNGREVERVLMDGTRTKL